MNNSKNFSVVLFFLSNDDGTYRFAGNSRVSTNYQVSLDIYANTPNPASQILGADTLRNLLLEVQEMKANMANRQYVDENVDPYI